MAITRATGTTSELVNVFFRDSRSVTTVGMANVSASSINYSWCRDNSVSQSSGTCTTNTVIGTWSTDALTQISSTSTLGWYQFGVPNNALAAGRSVIVHLWSKASTVGVSPFSFEVDLRRLLVNEGSTAFAIGSMTGGVTISEIAFSSGCAKNSVLFLIVRM